MMSSPVTQRARKNSGRSYEEETFEQVEGALTAYPAETREEALNGVLRGGNLKDVSLSFIRLLISTEN